MNIYYLHRNYIIIILEVLLMWALKNAVNQLSKGIQLLFKKKQYISINLNRDGERKSENKNNIISSSTR